MVYGHFWSLSNVGIRNENKSKISVMLDIHWWSVRLIYKTKAVFTHTKKLTNQGDRRLNSCHFGTK